MPVSYTHLDVYKRQDYYRTGAMTALFAIPLASLGFVQLVDIVRSWCAKALRVQADHPKCRYLPVGILVALMLMCQFFPFHAKLMGKTDIGAGLVKIHREAVSYTHLASEHRSLPPAQS